MSFYCHCTFSKIAILAYLMSILVYSPSVLAGGSKVKVPKGNHPYHEIKVIPEATKEELRKPVMGSQILNKPDYGASGMDQNSTQIHVQTREPDSPVTKLPAMERKEEASHHTHHQHEPCDKPNEKQGCQEVAPANMYLFENKLMGK
jgi:hypothetical protein